MNNRKYPNDFINKIICGDCLKVMKDIPDNSIDLVITSPPYNCKIDYDIYNDNLEWNEYIIWCEKWLIEIKRLLKEDGRFCLNVLFEMGIEENKRRVSPYAEFYNILKKIGLSIFGSPIWVDNHRVKYTAWGSWLSASAPYIYNPYEVVIITYKKRWKKLNKGKSTITKEEFMMGCSGIWKLRTDKTKLTKATFHTDLPKLCINLLSYEGDIILDPFMGSGTTAIACKELNRKYIGIEISPNYCKIAKKRLENK